MTTLAQHVAYALLEPDLETWDNFVATHPQGNLLQSSGWATLKTSAGWVAQRIVVLDRAGTLLAGSQVLFRHQYGMAVAYTPRGPLFSEDGAANRLMLHGLARLARRQRAIFLRLEPNLITAHPMADAIHTWLLLQGLRPERTIQPRSSVHVEINRPSAAILASFSKGHRADIRRAERNGVQVRVGTEQDIPAFYAIMQATGTRAGFGIHSAAYYRTAWQCCQPRSHLLLATVEGRDVAAHMVFADSQSGYYLYSGADDVGLKAGANHLLEWHAIQWAASLGCQRYDMWGIPDAFGQALDADATTRAQIEQNAQSDPLIGVYRFKKGFGGQIVRYLPAYDYLMIPPLYPLARQRIG